ncbi:MAG: hypothetical protein AAFV33_27470 [Chloroflexota bacterium]
MAEIDWTQWMNQLDRLPEDAHLSRAQMSEDDVKLKQMWTCAFPDGLSHAEVLQLIHLLYNEYGYGFRPLAHDVGIVLRVNYVYVLNEVYGVHEIEPDPEVQNRLRVKMVDCGYVEWMSEE